MSAQTPIKSLLIGISLAFLTNCILLTTRLVIYDLVGNFYVTRVYVYQDGTI